MTPWNAPSFESLGAEHFARLAALKPELVIFGSGPRLRFPPAALLRPLIEARIGVETMDTAAACRTYNVLLAEGRSVVAALLFSRALRRRLGAPAAAGGADVKPYNQWLRPAMGLPTRAS